MSLSTKSSSLPLDDHYNATTNQLNFLSLNDLLHPTEQSEFLLDFLTMEQLAVMENTLRKVKDRKMASVAADSVMVASSDVNECATTTSSPSPLPQQQQQQQNGWMLAASQLAKTLAESISMNNVVCTELAIEKPDTPPSQNNLPAATSATLHEPIIEKRDNVEWLSFIYSHHRVMRRYCIRTDVETVDMSLLDDEFKRENCVYPRANLPKEMYHGNRWSYETECNSLGWKLAWLNTTEIAGKRGLIQRAVDSYRNRYPSMRSRRVARQEKLKKGTLRKRKFQEIVAEASEPHPKVPALSQLPKTITVDVDGEKVRVKTNIESVNLDYIDPEFRRANCVFPRVMDVDLAVATPRQLDEAQCNQVGWKLAWMNSRQLANKRNLLQRVLDIYRTTFMPSLTPRKYSSRAPPTTVPSTTLPLTAESLQLLPDHRPKCDTADSESIYSGTTASLDFDDCISPPTDHAGTTLPGENLNHTTNDNASPALLSDTMLCDPFCLKDLDVPSLQDDGLSTGSSCLESKSSPTHSSDHIFDDIYDARPSSLSQDLDPNIYSLPEPLPLFSVDVDLLYGGVKMEDIDNPDVWNALNYPSFTN
ncbi:uncharacterized protein BYT42DRAFT_529759 [Radiomyces spectabilis]|uniref:uncharacterized protein n=1 Tax=Radiomyces spectabilis TaxID=64574 RepID=UPI00221F12E5|nr:uncharacterized protein BYT42DRAFT_529759 [Radiomyces spectabilis]KAI8384631.1 hypothetical protein BYT42DRAFT_529759 [Radiomyces spectabilis]